MESNFSKSEEEIVGADLEKLDSIVGDQDLEEVLRELSSRNLNKTPEESIVIQRKVKRDYSLVKALKAQRGNKCQFCDFTFKTSRGRYYSEAAHIKEIGRASCRERV